VVLLDEFEQEILLARDVVVDAALQQAERRPESWVVVAS
jgi:hypothetical protein